MFFPVGLVPGCYKSAALNTVAQKGHDLKSRSQLVWNPLSADNRAISSIAGYHFKRIIAEPGPGFNGQFGFYSGTGLSYKSFGGFGAMFIKWRLDYFS